MKKCNRFYPASRTFAFYAVSPSRRNVVLRHAARRGVAATGIRGYGVSALPCDSMRPLEKKLDIQKYYANNLA